MTNDYEKAPFEIIARAALQSGLHNDDDGARPPGIQSLVRYLYRHAYSRLDPEERAANEGDPDRASDVPAFSWTPKRSIDWGWQFCDRDARGVVLLARADRIHRAEPGGYLKRLHRNGLIEFGLETDIVDNSHNDWIFIKAGLAGLPRGNTEIRLYLNLSSESIDAVIHHIAFPARDWNIPFSFKFPKTRGDFRRCDAVVFYLDRWDAGIMLEMVKRASIAIKPFIRDSVPLFTQRLGPGIGLAESPLNGMSFGMDRMALCAHSLMKFDWQLLDEQHLSVFLKESFTEAGFAEKQYHLNPGSHSPYKVDF